MKYTEEINGLKLLIIILKGDLKESSSLFMENIVINNKYKSIINNYNLGIKLETFIYNGVLG